MSRILSQVLIFSVLTIFFAVVFAGCGAEAKLASGVKLHDVGEHHHAVEKFSKMDFENRYYRGQASFYLGLSYYNIGQASRAYAYFQRAIRYEFSDPVAHFYLGQSLRMREEYEEAIISYEEYLKHDVGNSAALNGIRSCKMALDNPQKTRYEVEMLRDLSSRESDYSPAFAGDDYTTVYFSSMRGGDKKRTINSITGQGSSVIYSSLQDGRGGWEDPVPFVGDKEVNQDDGTPSFSADGKAMYFTRCTFPVEGPTGASIMVRKRAGGRWGEPTIIPLGADSIIFAHPAISPDGETLYFVSDMPGGYGGKDIWKVQRDSGNEWGEPQNMGVKFNTSADEMFPYVRSDGRLYFSSDGLVGYGGLDIFEAIFDEEKQDWEIENMGLPINSPGHDFGIAFRGERNIGFLSSSRSSYRGVDDIYEFELPVIQAVLKGKVTNSSGKSIKNATVRIVGNNGVNMTIQTPEKGEFYFVLEPEANYIVMVSASGHYNGKAILSTMEMEENKEFERTVVLKELDAE